MNARKIPAGPAAVALFFAAAGLAAGMAGRTVETAPPATETPTKVETPAPSYDRPGFVTMLDKHGRLWVFRADSKELAEFREKGEPAKQVVRPKAGPDGRALKAPDAETIDAYLATK